jgi:hypothetical protein
MSAEKTVTIPAEDSKAKDEEVVPVVAEAEAPAAKRDFAPPEIIRNWTPEERQLKEKQLVRKIDFRLLPMIILMYILNYIDRCVVVVCHK